MKEELFEAKGGFQIIKSGRQIIALIFPDGTKINIGDKVITKKNCVVETDREGEVVSLSWPFVFPRSTDIVKVILDDEEFGWNLKPGEFEIVIKTGDKQNE